MDKKEFHMTFNKLDKILTDLPNNKFKDIIFTKLQELFWWVDIAQQKAEEKEVKNDKS